MALVTEIEPHGGHLVDRLVKEPDRAAARDRARSLKRIQLGPRELYSATVSSSRVLVPWVRVAPTVMADGALPGDVMPP